LRVGDQRENFVQREDLAQQQKKDRAARDAYSAPVIFLISPTKGTGDHSPAITGRGRLAPPDPAQKRLPGQR
jgi:hypothetical protein